MTPYLGQLFLNIAGFSAFISLLISFKTSTLKKLYIAQVVFITAAFIVLIYAHVMSDFSLMNVISHSHTQKPWLYKIAGTWGNHEGSMLLWVLLLVWFGLSALKDIKIQSVEQTRIILHSALNLLFISFLLLVCDPFEVTAIIPAEGNDLNPLLQDPLLAIHPPFLYAGYVGFVVPFIYVISNVFHKNSPLNWLSSLRLMVLIPWTLLSVGLGLGSFWAYYELGWGGWWFWDPVENTALIPWILSLLLLHSLFQNGHQLQTIRLIIVLSMLTFMSSLVGTLLVRSGLLVSVHSFAVDPARGVLLLGLSCAVLCGSIWLVYNKFPHPSPNHEGYMTRSGFIRAAILLMFAALFTLVFGTLYPLLSSYLGYPVTVGAPYFQMTFVPMMLPILCFLPFIPWLGWQQISLYTVINKVLPSLILSGFIVVFLWYESEIKTIKDISFSWMALWIMASTLLSIKRCQLSFRFIGMSLAHFGIGLAILGMILSSATEQEYVKALREGEGMNIAGYQLKLTQVTSIDGSNYIAQQAHIAIEKNGHAITTLSPEKRFYWTKGIIHGETAIYPSGLSHLYVALGEQYEGNIWSFRFYYKPNINLLWLGMICIALAGFILIVTRHKKAIVAVALFCSTASFSMEAHETLSDQLLEQRAMHVGRMILCPTCAGQNINDSVAEEAQDMRTHVRQLISQGLGDTEILDYFSEKYGEKILYQPALTYANILLWGLPWAIFLLCSVWGWRRYYLNVVDDKKIF